MKKFIIYKFFNFLTMFIILNIASMPPFSMFFLKWYSMYTLIMNSNLILLFIIMLLSSFLMFYIYLNMMFLTLFFFTLKYNFFSFNNWNNFFMPFYKIIMFLTFIFSSLILIIL